MGRMRHATKGPTLVEESESWNPVSNKLAVVRLLGVAMVAAPMAIVVAVVAWLVTPYLWIAEAVVLVAAIWRASLVRRQVRAIGWRVSETDFMMTRGIMFHRVLSVPLGRLQYLEVTQGPLASRFGLAQLQLHTAAALTDASIPGLPYETACELRDALSSHASSRLMGL